MTEHTPTPWRLEPTYGTQIYASRIGGCNMVKIDMLVADMRGWGCLKYHGEDKAFAEQQANAKHIVHCVNMYDELVEALENSLKQYNLLKDHVAMQCHNKAVVDRAKRGKK